MTAREQPASKASAVNAVTSGSRPRALAMAAPILPPAADGGQGAPVGRGLVLLGVS